MKGVGIVFALLAGITATAQAVGQPSTAELARGEYLLNLAGCVPCHTTDRPLAGGRPLVTPFGTFYSPNITPDPVYGIGGWSDADFVRALRQGLGPAGTHYYPAFPYPSFTGMTDEDMLALKAYLMTQVPVARPDRAHVLPWFLSNRTLIGLWKAGRFSPGPYNAEPTQSPLWNRGAYLADALGHCGECHTPRGLLGGVRSSRYLAGSRAGPEGVKVPNITPDLDTGVGGWSRDDMAAFLATGRRPDGSYTAGLMAEVLGSTCMQMTEADRRALVTYLRSLPPIHHDVNFTCDPFADRDYFE